MRPTVLSDIAVDRPEERVPCGDELATGPVDVGDLESDHWIVRKMRGWTEPRVTDFDIVRPSVAGMRILGDATSSESSVSGGVPGTRSARTDGRKGPARARKNQSGREDREHGGDQEEVPRPRHRNEQGEEGAHENEEQEHVDNCSARKAALGESVAGGEQSQGDS